jgi:hypothetical protein
MLRQGEKQSRKYLAQIVAQNNQLARERLLDT